MIKTNARSALACTTLIVAALSCAAARAGDDDSNPDNPRARPPTLTALEKAFEVDNIDLHVGADGVGTVTVKLTCEGCGSRVLQVTRDTKVFDHMHEVPLRSLRLLDGRPGVVLIKVNTDQVSRILAF